MTLVGKGLLGKSKPLARIKAELELFHLDRVATKNLIPQFATEVHCVLYNITVKCRVEQTVEGECLEFSQFVTTWRFEFHSAFLPPD